MSKSKLLIKAKIIRPKQTSVSGFPRKMHRDRRANERGTVQNHMARAKFHRDAAQTHERIGQGGTETAARHRKLSAGHFARVKKMRLGVRAKKSEKFDFDKNGKLDAHERAHKDEAKVIAKIKKKVKRRY